MRPVVLGLLLTLACSASAASTLPAGAILGTGHTVGFGELQVCTRERPHTPVVPGRLEKANCDAVVVVQPSLRAALAQSAAMNLPGASLFACRKNGEARWCTCHGSLVRFC